MAPKFFDGGEHEDGEPNRGKPALAQNVGPLPLWGWAVVVVGGVFVWRMMSGQGKVAASPGAGGAAAPAYPAGGVGGVFVIPSATGSAVPTPQDGATTATGGGIPYAFVRALDNSLAGRRLDPTTQQWGAWENLGGILNGDPVISGNWVLARAMDNSLAGRQWDPTTGQLGPWTNLGGIVSGSPGANIVSGVGA